MAQADHGLLKEALVEVHQIGFKKRELEAQGHDIGEILAVLNRDTQLAAGMSSMGPLVYAIDEGVKGQYQSKGVASLKGDPSIWYYGPCRARNLPYEVDRS